MMQRCKIRFAPKFKRAYRLCKRRGYDMQLLKDAIALLERDGQLPEHYLPHKLIGQWKGYWECHIQPDWLLIWKREGDEVTLTMTNTGTHADLFKK